MGDQQDQLREVFPRTEELLARFETEENRLQQFYDRIDRENEDPVFVQAMESCLDLCDGQEFWNLPFELRRMIYTHLLPFQPVKVHPLNDPENRDWKMLGEIQPEHCASARFVGTDFLKELWQTHLETSIFDFGEHFNMAPLFRTFFVISVAIVPVDYPLNLRLTISSENYKDDFHSMKSLYEFMENPEDWESLVPYDRDASPLLEHLEMLFGFAPRTKLHIDLVVDQSKFREGERADEWECEVLLPFIFPTLRRLAVTGVMITLCIVRYDCAVTLDDSKKKLEQIQTEYYKERSSTK